MSLQTDSTHHSVKAWIKSLLARDRDLNPNAASSDPSAIATEGPGDSGEPLLSSPPPPSEPRRLSVPADLISFHHAVPTSPVDGSLANHDRSNSLAPDLSKASVLTQSSEDPYEPGTSPNPRSNSFGIYLRPSSPNLSPPHASSSNGSRPPLSRSQSISKTLGQSVHSLQERLHHHKRASQTFRRMRAGSDAASEGSEGCATVEGKRGILTPAADRNALSSSIGNPSAAAQDQAPSSVDGMSSSLPSDPDTSLTRPALSERRLSSASATDVSSQVPAQAITGMSDLLLPSGEAMLKVTHKKVKQRIFKMDPDRGQITWESKKNNNVNLESIREVRFASSAASYRSSLNISSTHEPRWLTIIYQIGGIYKALHLIALSDASLDRWRSSLLHLQALRRGIVDGIGVAGNIDGRRNLWLKHHWKDADETQDEKLSFAEVQKLCRRLGIENSRSNLQACFNRADWRRRGFLDFEDFQTFVRLLKRREDVESIFVQIADVELGSPVPLSVDGPEDNSSAAERSEPYAACSIDAAALHARPPCVLPEGLQSRGLSVAAFQRFLAEEQKCANLNDGQDVGIFLRYCGDNDQRPLDDPRSQVMKYDEFLDFLTSSDNPPLTDQTAFANEVAEDSSARRNPTGFSDGAPDAVPDPSSSAQAKEAVSETTPIHRSLKSSTSKRSLNSAAAKAHVPTRAHAETAEELIAAGASNSESRKLPANLRRSAVSHDMTRPLSDYYISSSHNTYLVGGQWKGDSTVEGYIRALLQGARSVELDCWDGPNNTPHITHGRTLTTKVLFADVIAAIGRYAFVTSPYPVILSLEVHNDVPQQDVMAQILRDTLGDALLSQRLPSDRGRGDDVELPCPADLKYKILVKAKNLYLADSERTQLETEQGLPTEATALVVEAQTTSATETTGSENDALRPNARDLVRRVTKRRPQGPDDGYVVEGMAMAKQKTRKADKVLMSASLASLLIYTIGVKCRGLNKKEVYAVEHMFSLSEKTALKFIRDPTTRDSLIKHNRTHLSRVYPSMNSFARLHVSRNFLPLDMWAAGCQLVALNWQTIDLGFELNQAMFARNGRCGYVLKPRGLRIKDQTKMSGQRLRFCIDLRVISAQQLPRKGKEANKDRDNDDRDPIDPFVCVSLIAPDSWGRQPPSFLRGSNTEGSLASAAFGDRKAVKAAAKEQKKLPQRSSSLPVGTFSTAMPSPPAQRVGELPPTLVHSGTEPLAEPSSTALKGDRQVESPTASPEFQDPFELNALRKSSTVISAPAVHASKELSIYNVKTTPDSEADPSTQSKAFEPSSLPSMVPGLIPRPSSSRVRTHTVKSNGFSPRWDTSMSIQIEVPAGSGPSGCEQELDILQDKGSDVQSLSRGLLDLCFLRFEVYDEDLGGSEASSNTSNSSFDSDCVAAYAASVGSIQQGYRHLPLYGAELSQFLFSTLFVHTRIRFVGVVGSGHGNGNDGGQGKGSGRGKGKGKGKDAE